MSDWTFAQWYVAAVVALSVLSISMRSVSGSSPYAVGIARAIALSIWAGVVVALSSGGFF